MLGRSGSIPAEDSLNDAGSRLSLFVRKRRDRSAVGLDFLSTDDFGEPPVATFDEDVRQNRLNERQGRGFIKHSHVADALQSRQKQAAFEFRKNRPLRSL